MPLIIGNEQHDEDELPPYFLGILNECRQYYGTNASLVEGLYRENTILITIESKIDFVTYLGKKRILYAPFVYKEVFIRFKRERFKIF